MSHHHVTAAPVSNDSLLLIEDDVSISNLVGLHLKSSYHIETAYDGKEGYDKAVSGQWSLILLDLRLPNKDGLEICRDLRANNVTTPILILTSRSSELDRVLGLEMGADDYLVKPFSLLELEARVKALLRRTKTEPVIVAALTPDTFKAGDLTLNKKMHQVFKAGEALDLTAKEFDLLAFFMLNPNEVFSRTQLLESVWGYGHSGYEHTVNSHINRLRSKIETDPTNPKLIVTVWGVGYKLNA